VPPSLSLQRWNAAFPELFDITTFLSHAANLSNYIDERAISVEIWQDDLFISRTFNAVVHQLLSLPRHTKTMEQGAPPPQLVMREAIRRACIVLFGLLRDKFLVHPSGISQYRNIVKEHSQNLVRVVDSLEGKLEALTSSNYCIHAQFLPRS
jgi:hypothetical protein